MNKRQFICLFVVCLTSAALVGCGGTSNGLSTGGNGSANQHVDPTPAVTEATAGHQPPSLSAMEDLCNARFMKAAAYKNDSPSEPIELYNSLGYVSYNVGEHPDLLSEEGAPLTSALEALMRYTRDTDPNGFPNTLSDEDLAEIAASNYVTYFRLDSIKDSPEYSGDPTAHVRPVRVDSDEVVHMTEIDANGEVANHPTQFSAKIDCTGFFDY